MNLFLDRVKKRAVVDLKSDAEPDLAVVEYGETIPLTISVVDKALPNPDGRLWTPIDLTGWSLRAAIGLPFVLPVAGTFPVTFGANTTGALSYSIDATTLQGELNNLVSVTAAGGVVVVGTNGQFTITFNNVGARAQFTSDITNLAPASRIDHNTLIEGTAGLREVQTMRIYQDAATIVELTASIASTNIIVTMLQAGGGGLLGRYKFQMPLGTYSGVWSFVAGGFDTDPMAWDASEDEAKEAIENQFGADYVDVQKESDGIFVVTFLDGTAIGVVTASSASLRIASVHLGVLDLRTPGVELLLGGNASLDCLFEIEGTPPAGTPQKLFRWPVVLVAPILTPASLIPTPVISFYTQAEVDALLTTYVKYSAGAYALSDGWAIATSANTFTISRSGELALMLDANANLINLNDTWLAYGVVKSEANGAGLLKLSKAIAGTDFHPPFDVQPNFDVLTDEAVILWALNQTEVIQHRKVTLGGNRTLDMTNETNGMEGVLEAIQDATGGRTLALPAGSKLFGAPVTTANAINIYRWVYDGTQFIFTVVNPA